MVKIKFKQGPHFKNLLLIKHVYSTCRSGLKEAKDAVESGVIECPDHEYNDMIKMIEKCGGIQVEEMKPLPNDTVDMQSKKENVAAIRIVPSEYEEGLAIRSEIPVEKHVFQTLNDYPSLWQFVTNQIPFICGLTQLQKCGNGENGYCSLLAARIPANRDTVEEITSLSKVVRDVHAEMISTILKFHNLVERFKPFIDDVEVEARTNSDARR